MTAVLNRIDYAINRKRVRRLMETMGISAIYPGPNLSKRRSDHAVFPYLLRNLVINRVNQVWGVDITYVRLLSGFAYLVAFMDWFSRYVLSFAISTTLDCLFCVSALNEALALGKAEICNSDQGGQFTAGPFIACLQAAGIRISMDGRGRALDNVFTERLWRSAKYENIYPSEYRTPNESFYGLSKYFRFYNYERPHQSLGYKTPAEVFHDHR